MKTACNGAEALSLVAGCRLAGFAKNKKKEKKYKHSLIVDSSPTSAQHTRARLTLRLGAEDKGGVPAKRRADAGVARVLELDALHDGAARRRQLDRGLARHGACVYALERDEA